MTTALLSPSKQNASPADGVEVALHFLCNWFAKCSEGLAELRYKTANGMRQEFFALTHLENMARRAVTLSADGCEVYFGIAPRKERKGRKESVAVVPGLFCDLDFSAFESGGIEALERLNRFRPEPTFVVHTGGGLHLYWKLKVPLMPTPDVQAKIRSLAHEIGADPGATDLPRVLRVPGTRSHKRSLPVRLLRCKCKGMT